MNETMIILTLGPLTLTYYSVLLALSAALGCAATVIAGKKRLGTSASLSLCLSVLLGAVLGARLVYSITMLDSILVDFGGLSFIPRLWEGGFTLYGAILGGLIAAAIYCKVTKHKLTQALDSLAPGAALTLCLVRAAEYFTSQGLGDYIEEEVWQRFPFAVEGVSGAWQMPVFLYEAVAAAIIFFVVLRVLRHGRDGRACEVFLILVSVTQILLESWREDEFIRFGFVRWNQLAAAITLGVLLFLSLRRMVKAHGWTAWQIARIVLFVLCIAMVILIEFALDKSPIDNTLLYAVMALTLCVMGFVMLKE